MKLRKGQLRACAKTALEQRGFAVAIKSGPGIVTGARLQASKGSQEFEIAVRTSLDREIGLTRSLEGRWLTVSKVDEVVVVVPSTRDPHSAEVIGFDSTVLIDVFNQKLKELEEKNPKFALKSPVFVALDAPSGEGPEVALIARAAWTTLVPLASLPESNESVPGSFIDRIKREFAALVGVDVNTVRVEFNIIA
jgi:hypothetical protein